MQHVIQIKNGIMRHVNGKKVSYVQKGYSWNPSTCVCENGKYLKSITDSSVVVRDKIINAAGSISKSLTNTIPANVTNSISTNVANTVPKNVTNTVPAFVTSTVSTNFHNKKVRNKIITIHNCYYLLSLCKT